MTVTLSSPQSPSFSGRNRSNVRFGHDNASTKEAPPIYSAHLPADHSLLLSEPPPPYPGKGALLDAVLFHNQMNILSKLAFSEVSSTGAVTPKTAAQIQELMKQHAESALPRNQAYLAWLQGHNPDEMLTHWALKLDGLLGKELRPVLENFFKGKPKEILDFIGFHQEKLKNISAAIGKEYGKPVEEALKSLIESAPAFVRETSEMIAQETPRMLKEAAPHIKEELEHLVAFSQKMHDSLPESLPPVRKELLGTNVEVMKEVHAKAAPVMEALADRLQGHIRA